MACPMSSLIASCAWDQRSDHSPLASVLHPMSALPVSDRSGRGRQGFLAIQSVVKDTMTDRKQLNSPR